MAAAALLGMSGCGLEYLPYIHEPLQGTPSGGSFSFSSPQEVGLLFEGYEIYYKLYVSGDPSLTTESDFTTVDALKAQGFHRVTSEGDIDEDRPLVKVPLASRGVPHNVTIEFPEFGGQPSATVSWDAGNRLFLRRGILFPLDEPGADRYQSFLDFSEADILLQPTDLSRDVWEDMQLAIQVKLALFVASYGRNELGGALYSEPVYLFTIDYVAVTQ